MRQRRRPIASLPSRDRWIIPYADFVTLLFACFAALYAATALDAEISATAVKAQQGNGVLPAQQSLVGAEHDNTRQVRSALERELNDDLLAKRLELVEDRRGLVLAIPEAFAFDAGRAELSATARGLMDRIGHVLAALPNAIRVEGHTDTTPISTTRFASNWDLSTARATQVVAYFIDTAGLPPGRLSAAGYSEFHPRAENTSAAGRARNRRVDIVILNATTAAVEEPTPTP